MLVFSLAVAPLSVSHDATRAVNLLYCRSPSLKSVENLLDKANFKGENCFPTSWFKASSGGSRYVICRISLNILRSGTELLVYYTGDRDFKYFVRAWNMLQISFLAILGHSLEKTDHLPTHYWTWQIRKSQELNSTTMSVIYSWYIEKLIPWKRPKFGS